MENTPLQRALAAFNNNQSEMARICGVSQPTVWGWLKTGRGLLPGEYVLKVEAATGISRHELRPDIFGVEPSQAAA
jgi:DNA-binding transcriptional regulator YdaS (Cro superfamily)